MAHFEFERRIAASLFAACLLAAPFAASADDDGPEFRVHKLAVDGNEGSAIADVDGDGKLDVIAGRNWYRNPDFKARPLRSIADRNGYTESNGDHIVDVNGDGRPDVVSQSFFSPPIHWYENPGGEALDKGQQWPEHLISEEGGGANEASFLHDITGDGKPEFLVNSWANQPVLAFTFGQDDEGNPSLTRHEIGPGGHGHGMGFGDLNGDGRVDILVGSGWYEQPDGDDPLNGQWTFHDAWNLPGGSCPIVVTDVNGDGRNDIIWGKGHDYGIYWKEQLEPADDGTLRWEEHTIDETWSQAHAMTLADITGDGEQELVTGKRKWAHNGGDPGADDPQMLYYYTWNDEGEFTRHTIAEGVGTGLQINTADISGNGHTDIVVNGKNGAFIVFNEGP